MARRSGFERFLIASAREIARQQRLAAQDAQRRFREAERESRRLHQEERAREREHLAYARMTAAEEKKMYGEQRAREVERMNAALKFRLDELDCILEHTLSVDDKIDFDSLRVQDSPPRPIIPRHLQAPPKESDRDAFFGQLRRPSGVSKLFPWVNRRYERELAAAEKRAAEASSEWEIEVKRYEAEREKLTQKHERDLKDYHEKKEMRDVEVDAFRSDYQAGVPNAIVSYSSMVLERSEYPEGFSQNFSVAYQAGSKQLVIEYELPSAEIVPKASEYKYTKARDEITSRDSKPVEVKEIYADVIVAICLRTIHEIFEADAGRHIEVVCFNGYVSTVDPATGRDIQPHLISVRTTRATFEEIDLARVDKAVCLRNLGAQVSRRADEAQPVKPIVEFSMADARFVDQSDVVSGLTNSPNLMDLNPFEFEELVANLFGKMGLESKLTRTSRDGGVDCIAFDPRPVLGGKVVIQAKRYKNTVGVSAVRDLYGTMLNEGASKGLLVTTSGYGPDAFNFAKDKPIELIDGGGLLYLLNEIGIQARIIMPDE